MSTGPTWYQLALELVATVILIACFVGPIRMNTFLPLPGRRQSVRKVAKKQRHIDVSQALKSAKGERP